MAVLRIKNKHFLKGDGQKTQVISTEVQDAIKG